MLKLGERIFMNINKNNKKIINILFAISIVSLLIISSGQSLVLLLSVPIILAALALIGGYPEFLIGLLASSLISYLFMDIHELFRTIIPLMFLAVILILLCKSKISDKYQIAINFLLSSLVFIGIYKYEMITRGVDITSMARDLKEVMEADSSYDISDTAYQLSVALYPSVLSTLSLFYSIVSLKLLRNYMAYKKRGTDMGSLRMIRITKKDFIFIIFLGLLSYIVIPGLLGVNSYFAGANILWIIGAILLLNGIFTYEYIMTNRQSNITRGIRWFFVIVFFYFFSLFFIVLGIVDILVDFRNRPRRQIHVV